MTSSASSRCKFGLTNEILATKMRDATGCERAADLTEEQANEMIGVYMTWLNQLEEAAAENAKTAERKAGAVLSKLILDHVHNGNGGTDDRAEWALRR